MAAINTLQVPYGSSYIISVVKPTLLNVKIFGKNKVLFLLTKPILIYLLLLTTFPPYLTKTIILWKNIKAKKKLEGWVPTHVLSKGDNGYTKWTGEKT